MNTTDLIKLALQEDMPDGDLTTDSLGIESQLGRSRLVAKEDLILSGCELFTQTILLLDPEIQIRWHFKDGELVLQGQTAASLKGNLISMIKAERVALNFLGHLSGIATFTKCFAKIVENSKTQILDTRKTLPLYRKLEKQAVKDGGGRNHRLNLSDAIMIKENHIRLAGGVDEAVNLIREKCKNLSIKRNDSDQALIPITLECTNLEEVQTAIRLGVDRVLLDNMTDDQMKECLRLIPGHIETEASGNMNLDRVQAIADMGLDFISIGALTHSAPCADFSLLIEFDD